MTTTKKFHLHYVVMGLMALSAVGCAHGGGTKSGQEVAAANTGPSVVYARTQPDTIELNANLQPTKPAEVVADVKDFTSKVTDVKLQFTNVPLEVPMENIGGSVWRAQLSQRQLEMLAVNGHTTNYQANVVAMDADGRTNVSQSPVTIAIKAPDIAAQNKQQAGAAGGSQSDDSQSQNSQGSVSSEDQGS